MSTTDSIGLIVSDLFRPLQILSVSVLSTPEKLYDDLIIFYTISTNYQYILVLNMYSSLSLIRNGSR